MIFRHSSSHIGRPASLFAKSCACLLVAMLLIRCYSLPVTLRLQNIQTKQLAWWTDAQTPPGAATQTLILNPATDTGDVGSVPGIPDVPHGSSEPYSEWGLFPVFFSAGCYSQEVSWAGGSWQSVIAVGS